MKRWMLVLAAVGLVGMLIGVVLLLTVFSNVITAATAPPG